MTTLDEFTPEDMERVRLAQADFKCLPCDVAMQKHKELIIEFADKYSSTAIEKANVLLNSINQSKQ